MDRFTYLNYGLAAVLGFVGAKMLLADVVHIPIAASLGVIAVLLGGAVAASLRSTARPAEDVVSPTQSPVNVDHADTAGTR
jgi:tellurite resistance protein TerC